MKSALYRGVVVHQRIRPKVHRLRYRVFSLLLDLDDLPVVGRLRLFGHNSAGLLSFHDADHGDGSSRPLREWVDAQLADASIDIHGGRIALLCYPRMLGYVFNPLSVFFAYRADDSLAAILYEVTNTYGERHTYIIPTGATSGTIRQAAGKAFYVSPFLPDVGSYSFTIAPPDKRVAITVGLDDAEGRLLTASFLGRREELSDRALLSVFLSYPLMTLKVMGGIHWEALKMWVKGFVFRPHHPATTPIARTIIPAPSSRPANHREPA